jgi:fatty-acid desaturase
MLSTDKVDSPRPWSTEERRESLDKIMAVTAPRATPDVSPNPTPAYLVSIGWYVDWVQWLFIVSFGLSFPFVWAWQSYYGLGLTGKQLLTAFAWGNVKLVITFGILHRFFGHKSYSCDRPVAFVLALIAGLAGQRGGLWWGSKHNRHHKFCENEGDPHSAAIFGLFYAFVGWTLHPHEVHIDWDYTHRAFKVPELLLAELIAAFSPWLMVVAIYYKFGLVAALSDYWVTVGNVYLTMLFNVGLHHEFEPDETPLPNGRRRCRAHQNLPLVVRIIFDYIGELDHHDHHRFPRKAKHPATNGLDLPYWLFIYPGEKLGFFYGVNHSGTNTRRRSSVPNMADLAALAKSEAVVKATAEHPKVA